MSNEPEISVECRKILINSYFTFLYEPNAFGSFAYLRYLTTLQLKEGNDMLLRKVDEGKIKTASQCLIGFNIFLMNECYNNGARKIRDVVKDKVMDFLGIKLGLNDE